jgi:ketosteroid isomerase-like protein
MIDAHHCLRTRRFTARGRWFETSRADCYMPRDTLRAMSENDVEVVRRAHAEFEAGLARGNPAAAFDSGIASAEFEWILPAEAPGLRAVYRGREGFLEFMRTWTEDFDWSIELEQAVDAGDGRVVVRTHQRARGKGSGVPVELQMGGLWTVESGQVTRAENFFNPADAFEAAGLSERPSSE